MTRGPASDYTRLHRSSAPSVPGQPALRHALRRGAVPSEYVLPAVGFGSFVVLPNALREPREPFFCSVEFGRVAVGETEAVLRVPPQPTRVDGAVLVLKHDTSTLPLRETVNRPHFRHIFDVLYLVHDDVVLDWLDEHDITAPPKVVHVNINPVVSYSQINRRLGKLEMNGLVEIRSETTTTRLLIRGGNTSTILM